MALRRPVGLAARVLASAAVLLALTVCSSAQAQDQTAADDDDGYYYTVAEPVWYGWQTLVVDVPSTAGFFFAGREGEWGLAAVAGGVFVAGAPTIHLVHGRGQVSIFSLSTHLLLPVGGYALGSVVFGGSADENAAAGASIGALAAAALDAIVFGRYERLVEQPIEVEPAAGMRVMPVLGATGSTVTVGLAGFGF